MAALRAVTSINGDPEGGVACLLEAAVADAPQTEESWSARRAVLAEALLSVDFVERLIPRSLSVILLGASGTISRAMPLSDELIVLSRSRSLQLLSDADV